MKTVEVEVQSDYLQRLARVEPIQAIAELVWNGLDADAQRVEVSIRRNELGGPNEIIVTDNGSGMPSLRIEQDFRLLGGSWKQLATQTRKEKRALHGKGGQGRFRAFALGSSAIWITKSKQGKSIVEHKVNGYIGKLGKFEIDEGSVVQEKSPGTKVVISELRLDLKKSFIGAKAFNDFCIQFAPYLRQYPHVDIIYDGKKVDPSLVIAREQVYPLEDIEIEGIERAIDLEVIEWKIPTNRALYLCDQNGFALAEQKVGIQAPSYDFTAYLKSDYFRELDQANLIALGESNPGVGDIMEVGRVALREHFKRRKAEDAARIVEEWKKEEIYPYTTDPVSEIENSERKVFDLVAVNVSNHLPDFDMSDVRTRRFQFYLLRQALERNPESLQRILTEVLELPRKAQDDLASLLKKTSLTHVIGAAKVVADRLNFLGAVLDS